MQPPKSAPCFRELTLRHTSSRGEGADRAAEMRTGKSDSVQHIDVPRAPPRPPREVEILKPIRTERMHTVRLPGRLPVCVVVVNDRWIPQRVFEHRAVLNDPRQRFVSRKVTALEVPTGRQRRPPARCHDVQSALVAVSELVRAKQRKRVTRDLFFTPPVQRDEHDARN